MSFWHIDPLACVLSALTVMTVGALPAFAAEIEVTEFDTLPPAQIYLLGEVHDNAQHHLNQARAVASVQPAALVFEMLTPDQAKKGQGVDRRDAKTLDAALGWAEGGWGDIAPWHEIFLAAPEAQIYGAALPRDQVRQAIFDGAAAVFGEKAGQFGLTTPLPEAQQKARETLQDRAHCGKLPPEMIPGMVEAQRLRDASFARTALDALAETGGPVVVITGNGHVADWAMPAALAVAAPDVQVLSVGQVATDEQDPPYDLWITGPATQRDGDPCDAFD